jgi:hypothetical protein
MHEPRLEVVIVLRADAPSRARHAHHHEGKRELTARDVTQLPGAVHDLLHCVAEERREQKVDDGAQPGRRCPDRGPCNDAFGERCIADALRAELLQKLRTLRGDAFSEHDYTRVPAHFFAERSGDRFVHGHLRHVMHS